MKGKKRKKNTRIRGTHTCGGGFKKKGRGKGHRGGIGMAGTGKRADQKKSKVLKLSQKKYFGINEILKNRHNKVINLRELVDNLNSFLEKGIGKKMKNGVLELNLGDYKILGNGKIKEKLRIIVKDASETAEEKIKKIGGEVVKTDNV